MNNSCTLSHHCYIKHTCFFLLIIIWCALYKFILYFLGTILMHSQYTKQPCNNTSNDKGTKKVVSPTL